MLQQQYTQFSIFIRAKQNVKKLKTPKSEEKKTKNNQPECNTESQVIPPHWVLKIGKSTVKPMYINWKKICYTICPLAIIHSIVISSDPRRREALFFLHSVPKLTGIAWTLDANINGNSFGYFSVTFLSCEY